MNRREFAGYLCSLAAGLAFGEKDLLARTRRRRVHHVHHVTHSASSYKLTRIGISSRSFDRFFPPTSRPMSEELALLDFPRMAAERYKIHNLEFAASHFASTEPAYIDELKSQLLGVRSRLINIPLDSDEFGAGVNLSDPDRATRDSAVEATLKWIDIAAKLRARSIECNPGKLGPQNLAPAVDSYKRLAAYGRPRGVHILIENSAKSDPPPELINLFKRVGDPYLGALPNFANFATQQTRERGLKVLLPYASIICHPECNRFKSQDSELKSEIPPGIELSKQAKFRGIYSIEFDGRGDPYSAVQSTINELLEYV